MVRLLILTGLVALLAGSAFAHAEFRRSNPAAQAVLEAAPNEIVLSFSEPVLPVVMRFSLDGGPVRDVIARGSGSDLVVTLPTGVGQGVHLLSWRVRSLDGHPIGGSLVYAVGSGVVVPNAIPVPTSTAHPAAIFRFILTLALILGVGGAVFRAFVLPDSSVEPALDGLVRTGAWLVVPAAIGAAGTQGLDLLGENLGALGTADVWRTGIFSRSGLSAAFAVLAALMVLVAPKGRLHGPAALVALGLAALGFAVSSHAAVAAPLWLAAPSVAFHAATLIFWMGSLVPLIILLISGGEVRETVHRFSAIAIPAVVVLIATGAVLVVLQSGRLPALSGTIYGALLAAKLVCVLVLLALAATNRFKVTPALDKVHSGARRSLERNVKAEILVGVVVIALAAGFRLTVPPRSLNAAIPITVELIGTHFSGQLTLSPGKAGQNMARIEVLQLDGSHIIPKEVEIAFAAPDLGLEAIRVSARLSDDHSWETDPFFLPMAGTWDAIVDVLITDFSQGSLSSSVSIRN